MKFFDEGDSKPCYVRFKLSKKDADTYEEVLKLLVKQKKKMDLSSDIGKIIQKAYVSLRKSEAEHLLRAEARKTQDEHQENRMGEIKNYGAKVKNDESIFP